MSLQEQLVPDLRDTFHDPEEVGCIREFRFIDDRFEKTVATACVWDNHTLRTRPIVQQQGVFMGTVLLFIETAHFAVPPRPEQIIFTRELARVTLEPLLPVQEAWRVADVTDCDYEYQIALDKVVA